MNSTRGEIFADQFNACYNEENWFLPLKTALDGLTEEQFTWKESENLHSIRQIVDHLLFWNERYLMRFRDVPLTTVKIEKENDPTFNMYDSLPKDELIEKTYKVFDEISGILKGVSDDKLDENAFKNFPENQGKWWEVFENITIHNAYHIGQIVLIRKQLKNQK
jgi:uncharacterized damage-inducible protein DinB